jgi:hypothetical protein
MPGHIVQPLHRRCLDDDSITPADDTTPVADVVSLNDKEHSATNIFTDTTTDESGYKREYTSSVVVSRPATFGGSSNQDIKMVTITVADDQTPVTQVVLRTYSANIGEVDYYKREY